MAEPDEGLELEVTGGAAHRERGPLVLAAVLATAIVAVTAGLVATGSDDDEAGHPASTAPSTSASTAGVTTTSTTSPSALPPDVPPVVVVWSSGAIALHDVATGEVLEVLARADLGGFFLSGPERGADGTLLLAGNHEDYWFSCDSYDGAVYRSLADGTLEALAPGGAPQLAPDGPAIALLRSSDCRPDPEQPEQWVVAVPDTVVVRSLVDATERSWTFPGAVYTSSAPPVVSSVIWSGEMLVATSADRLVSIDPAQQATPTVEDGRQVTVALGDPRTVHLLGARADGRLVAQVHLGPFGEAVEEQTRLILLDPQTGAEVAELASLDRWTVVDADPSAEHWVDVDPIDATVVVDGIPVELRSPEGSEDEPRAAGW